MSYIQLHWHLWSLSAAALAIGGAFISRLLGRPPDPDEIERQRRAYLNQIGRIVEGQITDLVEVGGDTARRRDAKGADGRRKLVCYSYSISGVSYETAQDITTLQDRAGLERIITGLPASIKYDPSNPSNSILIADDWSGLR